MPAGSAQLTRTLLAWIVTASFALAALGLALLFVHTSVALRWSLPYSDQWQDLANIRGCLDSNASCHLADLWSTHNQHRLFLTRLLHIVDYRFFGGSNLFLVALDVALFFLLFLCLVRLVWPLLSDRREKILITALVSLFILNPLNTFNCLHSFDIQWILCYLAGFFVLCESVAGNFSIRRRVVLLLGFLLATNAGAFAVFPALAVMMYLSGVGAQRALVPLAAMIAALLVYYGPQLQTPVQDGIAMLHGMDVLQLVVRYVRFLLLVSSAVFGRMDPLWGMVAGALVLFAFQLATRSLVGRTVSAPLRIIHGMGLFAFFMMLETTLARAYMTGFDPYRFQIQSLVLWLSTVLILYFSSRDNMSSGSPVGARLALLLAVALVAGNIQAMQELENDYVFFHNRIVKTQHAYLSGISDDSIVHEAFGHLPGWMKKSSNREIIANVPFLREHRLGIFSRPQRYALQEPVALPGNLPACDIVDGRVMQPWAADIAAVGYLTGHIDFDLDVEETFLVLDAQDRITAYGAVDKRGFLSGAGVNLVVPLPMDPSSRAENGQFRVLFHAKRTAMPYCAQVLRLFRQ